MYYNITIVDTRLKVNWDTNELNNLDEVGYMDKVVWIELDKIRVKLGHRVSLLSPSACV